MRHLERQGLRVQARNVRTASGEIDIVATDGDDVVFVEVRTRRSAPGLAAESVDDRKLARMWDCAMEYCEAQGISPERARIDLVSVEIERDGRIGEVIQFRGVEIPEAE